jgi:hypothetical protein
MKKIVTLFVFLFIISCEGSIFNPYTDIKKSLSKCKSDFFERNVTFQKIQGNWKLVGEGCGGCSTSRILPPIDNIEIRISPDSTISTFKNSQLLGSNKYTFFTSNYEKVHYLNIIPEKETFYTRGAIEFRCEILSFRGGHTDGADYYFEKIK